MRLHRKAIWAACLFLSAIGFAGTSGHRIDGREQTASCPPNTIAFVNTTPYNIDVYTNGAQWMTNHWSKGKLYHLPVRVFPTNTLSVQSWSIAQSENAVIGIRAVALRAGCAPRKVSEGTASYRITTGTAVPGQVITIKEEDLTAETPADKMN